MDEHITKEIADLDAEIQVCAEKNQHLDNEIFLVAQKLKQETEQKKYLNYLVEDDLREIMENIQQKPTSMLVVVAA